MHLTLDPVTLLKTLGYAGLFFIVFAESGLFFGFFFPGDSLLFSAGLLSAGAFLSFPLVLLLVPTGAFLGVVVGYYFGAWLGPKIFTREDSFFFHRRHVERSREFFARYGPRSLVLARFVPVVRTFVPIVAGVGGMPIGTFLIYNLIGSILWGAGLVAAGYYLGAAFPALQHYLTYIAIGIVILSFLPIAFEWYRSKKSSAL